MCKSHDVSVVLACAICEEENFRALMEDAAVRTSIFKVLCEMNLLRGKEEKYRLWKVIVCFVAVH